MGEVDLSQRMVYLNKCENASIKAQTELPKYKFDSNKYQYIKCP